MEDYYRDQQTYGPETYMSNNYPTGWEEFVRNGFEDFQTTVRTTYAMNTLLDNAYPYGGSWSKYTASTYFKSNAKAFFDGALYVDYFNSWGSFQGMATSLVDASSRYTQIRMSESLTASYEGAGGLDDATPWMDIAIREIGQTEKITDPDDPSNEIINPRVQNYFTDGNFPGNPFTTSWCAIFVNYCLHNAGIKGTESWSSQSFLNWGRKIDRPVFGSIAVFPGHVGFVVAVKGERIFILGGNQSNKVYMSPYYKVKNVTSLRYPSMYNPNLWDFNQ